MDKVAPPRHECLRSRALVVMVASFLCNGALFGLINSYSVIYAKLQTHLKESGDEEASSKASVVGALTIGTTFFLSPVAGILTDRFGIRLTTFVGGLLAAIGMFLSSKLTDSVLGLSMTYGILFGVGASLTYTPSLVILGHYFKQYLGLVNGFVTSGSSIFTIVMPYAIAGLLDATSLEATLQCLAALMSTIMLCALLFKPIPLTVSSDPVIVNRPGLCKQLKTLVNVSIWKKKKYLIWALAVPSALFGYFVPYVHMVKFVELNFPQNDGKNLVMCLGITSGIGRLIFGKIADIPQVDRILLQQISFISIGLLTMLLPIVDRFSLLIVVALAMGLFDGCFISLLGPIAFEICGHSGASQAIGFLLGLCSIPLTVGPPIAGKIFDHTGSYKIPFILAGIPPIVGACALFLVRCVKSEELSETASEQVNTKATNGDLRTPPPPSYKEATADHLQVHLPNPFHLKREHQALQKC
ncbi:monocarboxylate transporter 10 isoform X2 [Anabrus simplex]|uniref:monocarboxylate transporter 10 isoform X2 n=1 Tax=Anabrus simplex TaxID=316456 RepID=UPI0035A2DD6F